MCISEMLIQRFVGRPDQYEDPTVRKEYGFLEAGVSMVGNLILAFLKLMIGFQLGSIALFADAMHSFSDMITSAIVLAGFKMVAAPPDSEHPYGHGRAESVIALIISGLLLYVGIEFFKAGYDRLTMESTVQGSIGITLILLIGAGSKEWMARFSVYLGKRIRSEALIADGWHHRSDAFASTIVALSVLGTYFGYTYLDAFAAMVVSGFIVITAWRIGAEAFSKLIGRQVSTKLLERMKSVSTTIEGVRDVHRIEVHDYGIGNRIGTMDVMVYDHLFVPQGHDIASMVELKLEKELGIRVTVHIEPFEKNARDKYSPETR